MSEADNDDSGFADGKPVPQVPFVYPEEASPQDAKSLVQRIRELPDDQLASMLEAALKNARHQGYEAGCKYGAREGLKELVSFSFRKGISLARAGRDALMLAHLLGSSPFSTQAELARFLDKSPAAVCQKLNGVKVRFLKEKLVASIIKNLMPRHWYE